MPTYYYRNRPPGIGCQPDGFTRREDYYGAAQGRNTRYHGEVEYPEALTHEQVYKYELVPADTLEAALFDLREKGDWLIGDYAEAPVEVIEQCSRNDTVAWWILRLREKELLEQFLEARDANA